MFIAHIPAGFLATRALQKKHPLTPKWMMHLGLVCSVLPDIDLFYFYLIDGRHTSHHHYWTHLPLFWLTVFLPLFLLAKLKRHKLFFTTCVVIFTNIMLHMVLDSVAAELYWFYPFSNQAFNLFKVEAQYTYWVWNFILHWTFALEILIVIAAFFVWKKTKFKLKTRSSHTTHSPPLV